LWLKSGRGERIEANPRNDMARRAFFSFHFEADNWRASQVRNEPHAFGMALSVADFDADGRLDLLMVGMNSPTAERLDHLGLKRPGFESQDGMHSRMIFLLRRIHLQSIGSHKKVSQTRCELAFRT
jgi:hypothetical protein